MPLFVFDGLFWSLVLVSDCDLPVIPLVLLLLVLAIFDTLLSRLWYFTSDGSESYTCVDPTHFIMFYE